MMNKRIIFCKYLLLLSIITTRSEAACVLDSICSGEGYISTEFATVKTSERRREKYHKINELAKNIPTKILLQATIKGTDEANSNILVNTIVSSLDASPDWQKEGIILDPSHFSADFPSKYRSEASQSRLAPIVSLKKHTKILSQEKADRTFKLRRFALERTVEQTEEKIASLAEQSQKALSECNEARLTFLNHFPACEK